jgi:hypothetical protein
MGVPPHRHRKAQLPEVEEASAALAPGAFYEALNTCPHCRWSEVAPGGWKCRRWPPVVNQSRPGESLFPMMRADDYCGEFSQ